MNLLFCGDVVGRAGREAVTGNVPELPKRLKLDFVVINGENAAHGFGLTEKISGELYDAGADVLTTGNHVWDQRELIPYIDRDPRVLRPANFPGRDLRRTCERLARCHSRAAGASSPQCWPHLPCWQWGRRRAHQRTTPGGTRQPAFDTTSATGILITS